LNSRFERVEVKMESSAQFRVAKQVQDLVQSFLPHGVNDSHI